MSLYKLTEPIVFCFISSLGYWSPW